MLLLVTSILLAAPAVGDGATVSPKTATASLAKPVRTVVQDFNSVASAANTVSRELKADKPKFGNQVFATKVTEQVGAMVGPLEHEQAALLDVSFGGKARLDNAHLATIITGLVYDCALVYAAAQSSGSLDAWISGFTSAESSYETQAKKVAKDLGFTLP